MGENFMDNEVLQKRDSKPEEPKQVPIQEPDPPPITGCFGCAWKKMLDFGYGTFSVVRFAAQIAVGQKTSDGIQAKREEICRGCHLFKVVKDGIFSCGVPITEKVVRIRDKDGCGCWLNLKWLGVSEKCPLTPSKW